MNIGCYTRLLLVLTALRILFPYIALWKFAICLEMRFMTRRKAVSAGLRWMATPIGTWTVCETAQVKFVLRKNTLTSVVWYSVWLCRLRALGVLISSDLSSEKCTDCIAKKGGRLVRFILWWIKVLCNSFQVLYSVSSPVCNSSMEFLSSQAYKY